MLDFFEFTEMILSQLLNSQQSIISRINRMHINFATVCTQNKKLKGLIDIGKNCLHHKIQP